MCVCNISPSCGASTRFRLQMASLIHEHPRLLASDGLSGSLVLWSSGPLVRDLVVARECPGVPGRVICLRPPAALMLELQQAIFKQVLSRLIVLTGRKPRCQRHVDQKAHALATSLTSFMKSLHVLMFVHGAHAGWTVLIHVLQAGGGWHPSNLCHDCIKQARSLANAI